MPDLELQGGHNITTLLPFTVFVVPDLELQGQSKSPGVVFLGFLFVLAVNYCGRKSRE